LDSNGNTANHTVPLLCLQDTGTVTMTTRPIGTVTMTTRPTGVGTLTTRRIGGIPAAVVGCVEAAVAASAAALFAASAGTVLGLQQQLGGGGGGGDSSVLSILLLLLVATVSLALFQLPLWHLPLLSLLQPQNLRHNHTTMINNKSVDKRPTPTD